MTDQKREKPGKNSWVLDGKKRKNPGKNRFWTGFFRRPGKNTFFPSKTRTLHTMTGMEMIDCLLVWDK